jgi:predicted metal-dependent peptidase
MLDKSCGEVGGAMQRWAEQSLRPRIDPRTALLRLVRGTVEQTTGDGDYSYRRPNRRNPHADMILPGRVLPVPRITVIVDTSGSMSERDLGLCVGLIAKVVNSLRIRDGINVVSGDTAAATVAKVFDPRKVKLAGGGGTDMGALIATAASAKPKPHLIVVATDGWTPWCNPVSVPVVACLTGRSHPPVPEWIRSVQLD